MLAQSSGQSVAAVGMGLLTALGGFYLAWKAFQQDRDQVTAMSLGTAVDQLAEAVKKQWDAEASVRRLNDPYPLPVAWRAADADLVQPWTLLADVARGWPGGPPGDPAQWPTDAAGLAGADAQIGEVFAQRVPTRRLVVLGDPGSGKSMLLIRLLHDLIAQRPDDGPVPVLFSLASWNPTHRPLQSWLADQLRHTYPGLRAPAPSAAPQAGQIDLAQALLDTRRILPLVDGFDELPPALHAIALDALNQALPAKQPLVLASRAAAYREALARSEVLVRPLNGAAGIHLLPLPADQAATYLRHDAGGEHTPAADRWNSVAAHLGTNTLVGQALSTPLGLFLARTIYNPRPDILGAPAPVPHPDELYDTTIFPTRAALDTHLFNAYIPAAYTRHQPNPLRWSPSQAYRTLVFLARHLETNRNGSPDLAWWELHHANPAYIRRLTAGLMVGLGPGLLLGLVYGVGLGLAAGIGLAAGLTYGLIGGGLGSAPSNIPSTRLRWSRRRFAGWLGAGLALGLVGGLAFGLGIAGERGAWLATGILPGEHGFVGWLAFGLALGLIAGLACGLTFGLTGEKPALTTMIGPATLLIQDLRTFLGGGLAYGLGAGFVGGFIGWLVSWLAFGAEDGLAFGQAFGLAFGLGASLEQTAWGDWVIAKAYLAMWRRAPWDLMTFLQDAHQHRGVLRQVGAVYQFRHLDLQRHLAQQPRSLPTYAGQPDSPSRLTGEQARSIHRRGNTRTGSLFD
ncbi:MULTISPECIES: NACHT domain-containing protein [Streptomyces]|uniref:NACHT domain-containing protein n=1 Tax=Streptomyces avermitilis (strain ATCC 31267 / DSM 46492 / JCM 5070 / NBRC 14893 / NCIMB 12804 / NRRL 8165 / MA-4680) TaxID=227882 RepID=Q82R96_STRAW|nr:NACHT domain-containing protein [Streptomyces avermitilis]MYS95954.1 NACHT domain-containing protein [Streptomyces sp. SID5469]BAC67956.1 hypothetical protein SAVERM_247 [Streptomyces avermitilis MA-4680 = NBRC 14893]